MQPPKTTFRSQLEPSTTFFVVIFYLKKKSLFAESDQFFSKTICNMTINREIPKYHHFQCQHYFQLTKYDYFKHSGRKKIRTYKGGFFQGCIFHYGKGKKMLKFTKGYYFPAYRKLRDVT